MGASHSSNDIIKRRAVAPSHRFYFTKEVPLQTSQTSGSESYSELTVKAVTWTKESHGLFDFEGLDTERKIFKLKGTHRFYRYENAVEAE